MRAWIQLHSLGSKHCTIKGNLRLPDATLSTVEDDVMVFGTLHQAQEVSVMVLGSVAKDTYIGMNGNNAGYTVLLPGPFASERCPRTFSD